MLNRAVISDLPRERQWGAPDVALLQRNAEVGFKARVSLGIQSTHEPHRRTVGCMTFSAYPQLIHNSSENTPS